MLQQIEVIYENGVFRPLGPLRTTCTNASATPPPSNPWTTGKLGSMMPAWPRRRGPLPLR